MAIENERLIPQQSVSTITNMDNIEAYIKFAEGKDGTRYMYSIDLPRSERTKAMRELNAMGITARSLFPGLDGAREELKERTF
jgi:hypothetical protein